MSTRPAARTARTAHLLVGLGACVATVLPGVVLPTVADAAAASTAGEASARTAYQPYAKLKEKDAPLRAGCHHYQYTYQATPPTNDWTINLKLKNPNGHGIAGAFIDSGADPARGRKSWLLCKHSTVSGRYHIKISVTYTVDQFTTRTAPVKPVYFRLSKPNGTGR